MSEAIAPVRESFDNVEGTVCYKPGAFTVPFTERPEVPSITSLVYYYYIPAEATKLRKKGIQLHVASEFGELPYTSISTTIRHDAPPPAAVHMAGFLRPSTVTGTDRRHAELYLKERREAEGRTTSIVLDDVPHAAGAIYRANGASRHSPGPT